MRATEAIAGTVSVFLPLIKFLSGALPLGVRGDAMMCRWGVCMDRTITQKE